MNDNYSMVAIGCLLILASIFARGVSYGMPPHRQKPVYPANTRLRLILGAFGLFAIALGLARALHG